MEIGAITEAIQIKSNLETKRIKKMKKRAEDSKDLETINQGKNTISSIFMSNNGKVNKITDLTRNIQNVLIFHFIM